MMEELKQCDVLQEKINGYIQWIKSHADSDGYIQSEYRSQIDAFEIVSDWIDELKCDIRSEPDELPEWAKDAIKKEFDDTGYLFRDDDTDDGSEYEMLLNNILSLRKPEVSE